MGRYQSTPQRQPGYNEAPEFHPIWRGIGFALIILIPVISYFAGLLVIDENKLHNYVPIPPDLINPYGDPMLFVKIIVTVAIAFLVYVVFMIITFVSFRLFGPARYGPVDAPPPRRKIRRRY
jgi:hypothetical protein